MNYIKKLSLLCSLVIGIASAYADNAQNDAHGAQHSDMQTKPIKAVIVSDTHVMAPELLVNSGTAWENYLQGERKLVDLSKPLFDAMVAKIKDELKPDLVFLTGDLTKDGEVVSHQYVVSKLDELRSAGIRVLVIPGNHDHGGSTNAVFYDGDATRPAETATEESFVAMYAHYGYDSMSQRESTTMTYSCEPVSGLVVIGIDSGREGTLSETTLNWVCSQATAARVDGKQVIALMHHPLIPHFFGAETFVGHSVLTDYEPVRNRLADAGVRVVFTGHYHTTDNIKDWNANLTQEIFDINTGSLISYPCDYRELTFDAALSQVNVATGHITTLDGVDDFPESAKSRLHTAVGQAVAARGTVYSLIAPTAADAFICHAEGDEHRSSKAAQTLQSLVQSATLAKTLGLLDASQADEFLTIANSMLLDKSQYGVEGRENQTDDLTLTIALPERTTSSGLSVVPLQIKEEAVVYNMNGQMVKKAQKGLCVIDGKIVVMKRQ